MLRESRIFAIPAGSRERRRDHGLPRGNTRVHAPINGANKMQAIKICEKNAPAIEAALREVNGKAEEYTFTRFTELLGIIAAAEVRALNLLGLKKNTCRA